MLNTFLISNGYIIAYYYSTLVMLQKTVGKMASRETDGVLETLDGLRLNEPEVTFKYSFLFHYDC